MLEILTNHTIKVMKTALPANKAPPYLQLHLAKWYVWFFKNLTSVGVLKVEKKKKEEKNISVAKWNFIQINI